MDDNQDDLLLNEINRRISIMESKEYDFPPKFSITDYIITTIVALVCLALIIYGAFI